MKIKKVTIFIAVVLFGLSFTPSSRKKCSKDRPAERDGKASSGDNNKTTGDQAPIISPKPKDDFDKSVDFGVSPEQFELTYKGIMDKKHNAEQALAQEKAKANKEGDA